MNRHFSLYFKIIAFFNTPISPPKSALDLTIQERREELVLLSIDILVSGKTL